MKTLLKILGIVILAMTCQSCSLDNDPQDDGNHRLHQDKTRKVYQFKLSLGGDYVEQSEEPLMRASEPNTYVGINVTCKDKSLVDAPTENYAYGVFTSKDDITIDLISGYTYDFEATILRDGTDKYDTSSSYKEPFSMDNHQLTIRDINKFSYNRDDSNNLRLLGLSSGETHVRIPDQPNYVSEYSKCMYPRIDRYYGILSDVDPDNLNNLDNNISINLGYKSFGIKIIVTDLPENTTLKVRDKKNPEDIYGGNCYPFLMFPQDLTFNSEVKEWEDIYSCYDLTDEQSISFTLEFKWDRGMGIIETFPAYIEVSPKIKKILQIKVTGSASTQTKGNIILETTDDSSTMTSSNQDVSHSGNNN